MTISIIIPIFNEKNTILALLKRVVEVDLGDIKKEIILVDDGSSDGTRDILKTLENDYKIIYHQKNQGKGAALRTAFPQATGDLILIQDADLEYDPKNYLNLMKPILEGKADVVFGSRFLAKFKTQQVPWLKRWLILKPAIAAQNYFLKTKLTDAHNGFRAFSRRALRSIKILTSFSNLLTGLHLTDMLTCHKIFRKEVIEAIAPKLTGNRFEIEPEITALIAKKKYRICEVPLAFLGILRTAKEVKKVKWQDGLVAVWYMIKFNLLR